MLLFSHGLFVSLTGMYFVQSVNLELNHMISVFSTKVSKNSHLWYQP